MKEAGTYTITVSSFSQDVSFTAPYAALEVTEELVADAYWPNFRGSSTNMAITDAATPTGTAGVKWQTELTSGTYKSPQIIVGDYMYVMAGRKLYKLRLSDGSVLMSTDMAADCGYAMVGPTYGNGMIFNPLSDGRIQAFDAVTLKSLWIYTDSLGGQAVSPILYDNGIIYTGFWNGQTKKADYAAIRVDDENTADTDEAKEAEWTQVNNGGYYWAGAGIIGNTVVFGGDDGKDGSTGDGVLYARSMTDGQVHTLKLSGLGDVHASIACDEENHQVWFTTSGGYLCRADVDPDDGTLRNLISVHIGASSTSTPVLYKGRVYAASGSYGSDGAFVCVDAQSMQIVYQKETDGYPQCSFLLSTAYEDTTGDLYFYYTTNQQPGGVYAIRVKADCTDKDDAESIVIYDASDHSNYCIASIICSADGTLYYRNDSGYLTALSGSSTEEKKDHTSEEASDNASETSADSASAVSSVVHSGSVSTAKSTGTGDTASAEVRKAIAALMEETDVSENDLISVYQQYEALSDAEKKQVANYEDLEKLTEAQGEKNHTDSDAGLSVDGLPWYIRLEVETVTSGEDYETLAASIGSNTLLQVWQIRLINTLTGEEYEPQETCTYTLTAPANAAAYDALQIVSLGSGGRPVYTDCSMSNGKAVFQADTVGIMGLIGQNEEEAETQILTASSDDSEALAQTEEQTSFFWPSILLAGAGAAILIYAIVRRRAQKKQDNGNHE